MSDLTKEQKEVLKIQYPKQYKADPQFKGRWTPPPKTAVDKYKKGLFTKQSQAINQNKKTISNIERVAKQKGVTPKQYLKSVGADTNLIKTSKAKIDSISTIQSKKNTIKKKRK